jgi:hypothetical protein
LCGARRAKYWGWQDVKVSLVASEADPLEAAIKIQIYWKMIKMDICESASRHRLGCGKISVEMTWELGECDLTSYFALTALAALAALTSCHEAPT